MKTRTYHHSCMGLYAEDLPCDNQGYVTIHDSPRYARATNDQLAEWSQSRMRAVRAAALTEQAERDIQDWRRG